MTRLTALNRAELDRHPLPPIEGGDKDSHGRLLVVAGSVETPGSALIAATAALRAGCGKVTIATAQAVAIPIALWVPEAKVIGLPPGRRGGFSRSALREIVEVAADCDAVVAGPGMDMGRYCGDLAEGLLDDPKGRLVLDAAILYELAPHAAACRAAAPILLPHDREMAALLDTSVDEANRDPLACGRAAVDRYGGPLLVKGVAPVVLAPDGRGWKYEGGGPGLGVSGSGDALAGILGGLLARGADPLAALLWAVWLHGEAGAALAKKVGPLGFLAREIPGEVPALLQSSFE